MPCEVSAPPDARAPKNLCDSGAIAPQCSAIAGAGHIDREPVDEVDVPATVPSPAAPAETGFAMGTSVVLPSSHSPYDVLSHLT